MVPTLALNCFAGMLPLHSHMRASRDEAHVLAVTSGAHDAIRPAPRNHEGEAVIGIGEVNDGLLKCLWLFHGVPHSQRVCRRELLSQVYYCPYDLLDLNRTESTLTRKKRDQAARMNLRAAEIYN